jgi:hypothetical protein
MDCLNGYIGVSSKESTEAESGLYVDSLPDISLSSIEKLSDIDSADFNELWKSVEKRGILKFRTLFINEVNRCHRISKISICECLICSNKTLLATSIWYLLGAEIMFERANSSRLNKYTTIDRAKAKELRAEFMDLFHSELSVAVAGINIHESDCIEEQVGERNLITTYTPIM